jgi:hypothetical protein
MRNQRAPSLGRATKKGYIRYKVTTPLKVSRQAAINRNIIDHTISHDHINCALGSRFTKPQNILTPPHGEKLPPTDGTFPA